MVQWLLILCRFHNQKNIRKSIIQPNNRFVFNSQRKKHLHRPPFPLSILIEFQRIWICTKRKKSENLLFLFALVHPMDASEQPIVYWYLRSFEFYIFRLPNDNNRLIFSVVKEREKKNSTLKIVHSWLILNGFLLNLFYILSVKPRMLSTKNEGGRQCEQTLSMYFC